MTNILSKLNAAVWGAPALLMILGVGLFLSVKLKLVQLELLPEALRRLGGMLRSGQEQGDSSSFRALCTALGATVGTGNLVGVAGAICVGGPGAVFWMWMCGIAGMVTKYAEAVLAVRFRVRQKDGWVSGPMHVITRGMGQRWRPLAVCYCLFGMIAAFGVGNATQINAVVTAAHSLMMQSGIEPSAKGDMLLGLILAALVGVLLFGGAGRIGSAAQRLVPLAAAGYILMCAGVLAVGFDRIGEAFGRILLGAWDPKAVTGGALGSAFQALRVGCSRGVFTNEAGMGTAAIAHGAAQVSHPAEQGMMGILEVFLDTHVICTLTALVILVSGVPIPYGKDVGAALAACAFAAVYGRAAAWLITGMLTLFALATVLGWGLYGTRCVQFLFGYDAWRYFAGAQTAAVVLGALADPGAVWQFAELLNGLMVIPNLISLAALSNEVSCLTIDYRKNRRV